MAGTSVKIKEKDNKIEILINGKPIDLCFLKSIKLDMTAGRQNILTLEYKVQDIDIETDNSQIEILNTE